jgi:iron(III) transport system substrate-binding protein
MAVPAAAVILLVGAACGGSDSDDKQTTGGAGDTKELTVYSGRDEELVGPLFARFEKETGIDLKVRYGDTAELAATIREEGDNSPADVFFGQDAGALGALEKDGVLAPLPAATLDRVPTEYRSADGAWVGTSGRARVIAYDKRALKADEVPQSVFELTDPRWKGKVAWAPTNASFQAFVTGMRKLEGDDRAEKWLKDMKSNGTKAYEKNSIIRDAIANKEIELGLINHYYVLAEQADADGDYPVEVSFTKEGDPGSLVNVAGGGVLKTSEVQQSGTQLLDYLLADEQQRYFAEMTFEYPLVPGVASPAGVPRLGELSQPGLDLSDLDDLQGTLELLEQAGVL